jgi:hypothetical protein
VPSGVRDGPLMPRVDARALVAILPPT